MRLTVERITPDVARSMLDQNTVNFRNLDLNRVKRFAREMSCGNWACNGETIKFKGDILVDGQHRLAAVIESGSTIQSAVAYGDIDCSKVDRGKPRSIAQWLKHCGYLNACVLQSSSRLCLAYEKGMWDKQALQQYDVIDSEIITFVEQNSDKMQDCIRLANRAKDIITPSISSAILFHGTKYNEMASDNDLVIWFINSLASGEGLSNTDAVLHLRERMIRGKNPNHNLSGFMKRALCTLAWNKTANGDECTPNSLRIRMTGPAKSKPPKIILKM